MNRGQSPRPSGAAAARTHRIAHAGYAGEPGVRPALGHVVQQDVGAKRPAHPEEPSVRVPPPHVVHDRLQVVREARRVELGGRHGPPARPAGVEDDRPEARRPRLRRHVLDVVILAAAAQAGQEDQHSRVGRHVGRRPRQGHGPRRRARGSQPVQGDRAAVGDPEALPPQRHALGVPPKLGGEDRLDVAVPQEPRQRPQGRRSARREPPQGRGPLQEELQQPAVLGRHDPHPGPPLRARQQPPGRRHQRGPGRHARHERQRPDLEQRGPRGAAGCHAGQQRPGRRASPSSRRGPSGTQCHRSARDPASPPAAPRPPGAATDCLHPGARSAGSVSAETDLKEGRTRSGCVRGGGTRGTCSPRHPDAEGRARSTWCWFLQR